VPGAASEPGPTGSRCRSGGDADNPLPTPLPNLASAGGGNDGDPSPTPLPNLASAGGGDAGNLSPTPLPNLAAAGGAGTVPGGGVGTRGGAGMPPGMAGPIVTGGARLPTGSSAGTGLEVRVRGGGAG